MKNILYNDRTFIVELLSVMSLIGIAIVLGAEFIISPDSHNSYFWVSLLTIFSFFQGISLAFKEDLQILRICMSWVVGVTWVWLSYISIGSILFVPTAFIGFFNIYAFVALTNKVKIDYQKFLQE